MNALELFAGIGGLSLGLERAGVTVVGQVEIDPFCRAVLERHWPGVPRHDDVRTAVQWWASEPRPAVDIIAGGYPCQPESLAGKRRGTDDQRWLWPEFARLVHAIRPRYVLGENVMGHRTGGLRFVLRDLDRLGYTARAGIVSAEEVGAPHRRQRIFVLADAERVDGRDERRRSGRPDGEGPAVAGAHGAAQPLANAGGQGLQPGRGERGVEDGEPTGEPGQPRAESAGCGWWAAEPDVGRVAYGAAGGVDRRRALGNACTPQQAEFVARLLLSGEWLDD